MFSSQTPAPSLGFVVVETVRTPEPVLPDPFIAAPPPSAPTTRPTVR